MFNLVRAAINKDSHCPNMASAFNNLISNKANLAQFRSPSSKLPSLSLQIRKVCLHLNNCCFNAGIFSKIDRVQSRRNIQAIILKIF